MQIGALFDWDGVIIDSARQHEESWTLLARELGQALPPGHFKNGFGRKKGDHLRHPGLDERPGADPAAVAA